MSDKKLLRYLEKENHYVPVIIGPKNKFYIFDHHHMLTALYNAKIDRKMKQRYVIAKVYGNWYVLH